MKKHEMEDPELNVAPLIDMVFLLLVYFMVTASLVKSEGDLGIRLPSMSPGVVAYEMADEQIIEVCANGRVYLNDREYDRVGLREMPQLTAMLTRYRAAYGDLALVTVNGHDEAEHQRVIDVLDACAAAGVVNVTFSGE